MSSDHNKPRPAGVLDTGYNENLSPRFVRGIMREYSVYVADDVARHAHGFYQSYDGDIETPLLNYKPQTAQPEVK